MLGGSLRSNYAFSEAERPTNSATKPITERSPAVQVEVDRGPTSVAISSAPLVDQMASEGASARDVVRCLLPNISLPDDLCEEDFCRIIRQILYSERPKRTKLPHFNTFDDAVELFKRCSRILVLTGAGVSVSCGIPDFRSKNGIYARLHFQYPDLPDPTAVFDISYFSANPKPFFEFARELFPGRYKPSLCHYFIKALEDTGKLLRNYTQNIDTLEQEAGIKSIVQCHGSFATATCRNCGLKVESEAVREDIESGRVAMCRVCKHPKGVLKPDIVFFGEDLSDEFHEKMAEDRDMADLVVVIGSSLKVQPVALIPYNVNPEVPQILINRESLPHYATDIQLLGNCDDIVTQLALALGRPFTDIFNKGYSNGIADDSVGNEQICEKLAVRNAVDEMQFKKLLDQPAVKRARVKDELLSMWDARYVNVGAKLPDDAYLFIVPNKNIFPGAEMFYDKDDDTFCQLTERCHSSPSSSSSDSEECEADHNEVNCRFGLRAMSLEGGAFLRTTFHRDEERPKSSSCPPKLNLDIMHGSAGSSSGNGLYPRLEPFLQTAAVVSGDVEETKDPQKLSRTSSCKLLHS